MSKIRAHLTILYTLNIINLHLLGTVILLTGIQHFFYFVFVKQMNINVNANVIDKKLSTNSHYVSVYN